MPASLAIWLFKTKSRSDSFVIENLMNDAQNSKAGEYKTLQILWHDILNTSFVSHGQVFSTKSWKISSKFLTIEPNLVFQNKDSNLDSFNKIQLTSQEIFVAAYTIIVVNFLISHKLTFKLLSGWRIGSRWSSIAKSWSKTRCNEFLNCNTRMGILFPEDILLGNV